MKFKKHLRILLLLAVCLTTVCTSSFAYPVFAGNDVKVTIDGTPVLFPDQKPIIVNGRTLVPVKFVSEKLGASVEWLPETKNVVIKKSGDTIIIGVDTKTLTKNGVPSNMDVAPTIINGRTMVPLKFVSEQLGASVEWDAATSTAITKTAPGAGSTIILPPDADDIDRKIQELAKSSSSWARLYEADKESAREYFTDLENIRLNLDDKTTYRSAGYDDEDTGDGYVSVWANCNDENAGKHSLYFYQHTLTKLSYDAMWTGINSIFSDSDSIKIWASYLALIKNAENGNWADVTGTAGGYSYNCHPYNGNFAISFDTL